MDEDMHGPLGDTYEVVLALMAMFTSLAASVERDSPGTIASVAKTAEAIISTTMADQIEARDKALAHVSRLAGQAARLVHRAQKS